MKTTSLFVVSCAASILLVGAFTHEVRSQDAAMSGPGGIPRASESILAPERAGTGSPLPKPPRENFFESTPRETSPQAVPAPPSAPGLPERSKELSEIEKRFLRPHVAGSVPRDIAQFGYDLFGVSPSTFAPVQDVPIREDYVVGPGDSFIVHSWDYAEGTTNAPVDREGKITLPKIGPLFIWGSTFGQAKKMISDAYTRQYSGIRIDVTMGALRTIKVYVLGDVLQPGAYEVSALATATNALMSAGGPTKLGSLRRIRLLRNNVLSGEIDLYKFLLEGDRSQDYRLESGDALFVPPIGPVMGISGDVKRPAIYEMKDPIRLKDLVDLAGGLTPLGYLKRIQIERVEEHEQKIVMDVTMSPGDDSIQNNPLLQDADFVSIFDIYGKIMNAVTLQGAIRHSGTYELKPGMRLKELLEAGGLLPDTDPLSGELIRINRESFETTVIPITPKLAMEGKEDANIALLPEDKITLMSLLQPVVLVTVSGEVRFPGTYIVRKGERISSVLHRAGGLTDQAFMPGVIFTRQSVRNYEKEQLNKFKLTQERMLAVEAAKGGDSLAERRTLLEQLTSSVAVGRLVVHLISPDRMEGKKEDLVLENGDSITIPAKPSSVQVLGSVNNPTAFMFEEGKDLRSYIAMAGGLSPEADKNAVYILRADGSAVASYVRVRRVELGDAIIVPPARKKEYPRLPFYVDTITILGQLSLTVAALATLF